MSWALPGAWILFTAPAMWAGLVFVALPITAHFLNRTATRTLVFPSLELLRQTTNRSHRWLHLRRWLLLLLRLAIISLLVAVFALPVLRRGISPPNSATRESSTIVLVDVSASMSLDPGSGSLLARAQAAADRLLAQLQPPHDRANVIWVDRFPQAVFPELSTNVPMLRDSVRQIRETAQFANISAALQIAGRQLRDLPGRRRVVVISDFQESNWSGLLEEAREQAGSESIEWTLVNLDVPRVDNIRLTEPRIEPRQPFEGQDLRWIARATSSATTRRQIRVTPQVDDHAGTPVTIELAPGEAQELIMADLRWTDEGPHELRWEIDRDALVMDNRTYSTGTTQARMRVAVVSDEPVADPTSAGYFIVRALVPQRDPRDRFVVDSLTTPELTLERLQPYACVVISYVGSLTEATAQTMRNYVAQGGTLLWLCGAGTVDRHLQILDQQVADGWLPWSTRGRRLGATIPRSGPSPDNSLDVDRLAPAPWTAPWLRTMDLASQTALQRVAFRSTWRIEQERPAASILLRFSSGQPALATCNHQLGTLFLANFSPAPECSDLGQFGAFVPFLQLLVQQAATARASATPHVVGDSLAFDVVNERDTAPHRVVAPDGSDCQAQVTSGPHHATYFVPVTEQLGFYRLERDGKTIASQAVNLDERESQLSYLEIQPLQERLAPNALRGTNLTMSWHSPDDWHDRPLWPQTLLAAMWLGVIEWGLLAWWKR